MSTAQARVIDFDIDAVIDVMLDGEMLKLRPQRLEVLPSVLQVRA